MREPNRRLAQARRRQEALLPHIAALTRQGQSTRQIAKQVEVSKSTVIRWQN